jgi:hypothetical protein
LFNLDSPSQPLLMVGGEIAIRPFTVRQRKRRTSAVVRKS